MLLVASQEKVNRRSYSIIIVNDGQSKEFYN